MVIAVDETQHVWSLSLERYHELIDLGAFDDDERLELIEGTRTLIARSPKGSEHDDLIEWLGEQLVPALAGRARVRIQSGLTFPELSSEPEPDVAVVARDSPQPFHPSTAMLVIEVAASSLRYDSTTKASLYARAGVAEYWVLDVAARAVVVHSRPGSEGYRTVERRTDGVLVPAQVAGVELNLSELWAVVSPRLPD